ncbi:calpain-1 catalytic subunit-like [Rhinophrynus dorsalis]
MLAGQCYQSLRTSCLEARQLFVDPVFPHVTTDPNIEWKRPPEFCSNPKFIESWASTTDICQGELGDCWLLSSISSLTLSPKLFSQVVPDGQSFCPSEGYCGMFHFRLWRFGEWMDIVVDDILPTKGGRLLYTRSDTRGEMWSALLEKAYAKVCGGYAALQGRTITEALEDFTGGIAECLNLRSQSPEKTWDTVSQSEGGVSLMACYIQVSEASDIGHVNVEGLVLGHAYSVIGARKVHEELVSQPRMGRDFFARNCPVGSTGDPQNSRGVMVRLYLSPGEYLIVPSTHNPKEEGNFYIRVYFKKRAVGRSQNSLVLEKVKETSLYLEEGSASHALMIES